MYSKGRSLKWKVGSIPWLSALLLVLALQPILGHCHSHAHHEGGGEEEFHELREVVADLSIHVGGRPGRLDRRLAAANESLGFPAAVFLNFTAFNQTHTVDLAPHAGLFAPGSATVRVAGLRCGGGGGGSGGGGESEGGGSNGDGGNGGVCTGKRVRPAAAYALRGRTGEGAWARAVVDPAGALVRVAAALPRERDLLLLEATRPRRRRRRLAGPPEVAGIPEDQDGGAVVFVATKHSGRGAAGSAAGPEEGGGAAAAAAAANGGGGAGEHWEHVQRLLGAVGSGHGGRPSLRWTAVGGARNRRLSSTEEYWQNEDSSLSCTYWSEAPYGTIDPNCPSAMKQLDIGLAYNVGAVKKLSGLSLDTLEEQIAAAALAEADAQWVANVVNALYHDQANIYIRIAQLEVRVAGDTGEDWNQEPADLDQLTGGEVPDCTITDGLSVCSDCKYVQGHLKEFGQWRAALDDEEKHGLWHLVTACFPPSGVTGIAYGSSTCVSGFRGAGWTQWGDTTALRTWQTVAHELGHNLGSGHTFDDGGIMDYGTREFALLGDAPVDVCAHIATKQDVCFSSYEATCGNKIVEDGEECDDDTICCNPNTCKIRWWAQCSFGNNEECCTAACKHQSTTTSCSVCGLGEGYCVNGHCQANSYAVGDPNSREHCDATESFPCEEHVSVDGGVCQSSSNWDTSHMPDGAKCDYCKSCVQGVCTEDASCRRKSRRATQTTTVDDDPSQDTFLGEVSTSKMVKEDGFLTPSEGEVLYLGDTVMITWTPRSFPEVTLYYNDHAICFGIPNTGSFQWYIDGVEPAEFAVLYLEDSQHGDLAQKDKTAIVAESKVFKIEEAPQLSSCSLSCYYSGGAGQEEASSLVSMGTSHHFRWNTHGAIAEVKIELFKEKSFLQPVAVLENRGAFTWIPDNSLSFGSGYFMKIRSNNLGQPKAQVFCGPFTIMPRQFDKHVQFVNSSLPAFVSPSTPYTIEWNVGEYVQEVFLHLQDCLEPDLLSIDLGVDKHANSFELVISDKSLFEGLWKLQLVGHGMNRVFTVESPCFPVVGMQPRIILNDIFEGQDGELWNKGLTAAIDFEVKGPVEKVQIELVPSKHPNTSFVIYEGDAFSPFQYNVPQFLYSDGLYELRIHSMTHGLVSTKWPDLFYIGSAVYSDARDVESYLHLSQNLASGTESYPVSLLQGKAHTLKWDSEWVRLVDVWLIHAEDGKTLSKLESRIPNTGRYTLTIPHQDTSSPSGQIWGGSMALAVAILNSEDRRVRIESFSFVAKFHQEVAEPKLIITEPADGHLWTVGLIASVAWESIGNVGESVSVEVLCDSPLSASGVFILQESGANAGQVEFAIPELLGNVGANTKAVGSCEVHIFSEITSTKKSIEVLQQCSIELNIPGQTVYIYDEAVVSEQPLLTASWNMSPACAEDLEIQLQLWKGRTDHRISTSGKKCLGYYESNSRWREGCSRSPQNHAYDDCAVEVNLQGQPRRRERCRDPSLDAVLLWTGPVQGGIDKDGAFAWTMGVAAVAVPRAEYFQALLPGRPYTLVAEAVGARGPRSLFKEVELVYDGGSKTEEDKKVTTTPDKVEVGADPFYMEELSEQGEMKEKKGNISPKHQKILDQAASIIGHNKDTEDGKPVTTYDCSDSTQMAQYLAGVTGISSSSLEVRCNAQGEPIFSIHKYNEDGIDQLDGDGTR